jgi:hypothetical protein
LRRNVQALALNGFSRFKVARRWLCATQLNTTQENTFSVGKYLVSPLTRRNESGQFIASVSIRSGHGRGTHDRVLRFVPEFNTHEGAVQYAIAEGHSWLEQRHGSLERPSLQPNPH